MKKLLLLMLLVGILFSCSEAEETPMTQDEFFSQELSWTDYVGTNRSPVGNATLFYGGTSQSSALESAIIELDLEKNIIGIDRDIAEENDPYNYEKASFRLTSYSYYEDFSQDGAGYSTLYYYTIREGERLAPGSSDGHININYHEDETPLVVSSTIVDMEAILDEPGNEGLVIGDEVLIVDIYKDEAKTDLVESFTFIL